MISLNQWKMLLYSRCVWAGADAPSVDVTFLPKRCFDVAVATRLKGTPSPLLSFVHYSSQQQTKTTHILSLALSLSFCSSPVWTGPVLSSCGPVQSSCPIFRDYLVCWPQWLTYSLSCLTCMCASIGFLACCFVLGTPHHMLQKRLSGRHAELLSARLSDVTSRRLGTNTLW